MSKSKFTPQEALAQIESKLLGDNESRQSIVLSVLKQEVEKTKDRFGVPKLWKDFREYRVAVKLSLIAEFPNIVELMDSLPLLNDSDWSTDAPLKLAVREYREANPSRVWYKSAFLAELSRIDYVLNHELKHTSKYLANVDRSLREIEEDMQDEAKSNFKRSEYLKRISAGNYEVKESFMDTLDSVVINGVIVNLKKDDDNVWALSIDGTVLTWYDTLRDAVMSLEERLAINEKRCIEEAFSAIKQGKSEGEAVTSRGFSRGEFEILLEVKGLSKPDVSKFHVIKGGWKVYDVVEAGEAQSHASDVEMEKVTSGDGLSYSDAEALCNHLRNAKSNASAISFQQNRVSELVASLDEAEAKLKDLMHAKAIISHCGEEWDVVLNANQQVNIR